MTLKRLTTIRPAISAAELRSHLRNFNSEEDALLTGYILAAQQDIEICCERALTVAKFRLTLPDFPRRASQWINSGLPFEEVVDRGVSSNGSAIFLNMPPVRKLVSVEYYDGNNQLAEYNDWNLFTDFEPAQLTQALDTNWPTVYRRRDAVTVTFWAGEIVPLTVNLTSNVITSTTGYPFVDGEQIEFSFSGNSNSLIGNVAQLPGGLSSDTTYFVRDVSGATFKVAATSGGTAIDLTAAATDYAIDLVFAGTMEPIHRLALLQLAAVAHGKRCPQGGCVCSADEYDADPMLRRLRWRSPVEFV